MRNLFLAALGVFAVAGVASAQQPQYQPPAIPVPVTYPPGAVAATPIQPTSGATVIRGDGGCTNCGSAATKHPCTFTMSNVTGGKCGYGYPCQNGCGSIKSDLAFHFGTCSQFFSPCGPTCGGLFKKCPTLPYAQPWGTGYACPPAYDSHNNH